MEIPATGSAFYQHVIDIMVSVLTSKDLHFLWVSVEVEVLLVDEHVQFIAPLGLGRTDTDLHRGRKVVPSCGTQKRSEHLCELEVAHLNMHFDRLPGGSGCNKL